MKKIALISDGWKRLITYAWVQGIMDKIHETNRDVALYQYNCYGNWSKDELHNKGEYNIYNLPDLSTFDGIVLDCSNIVDKEQFDYVVKLLRASGVPVVSIGYNIEGFYYASIDNRQPIIDIMEHLYHVHGCRKFIFAGGPLDNYENSVRTNTYKTWLHRMGLRETDNPCWYGDYDYDTGVTYMKDFLESGAELPDAFVCANDNIAAGMCAQAAKAGFRIPEDFRVTGFDNLDKAAFFKPQISTVAYDREKIGRKCFEVLAEIWDGKEVPRYNYVQAKCLFSESCGCKNNGSVDYREYIKNQIVGGVKKQADDERLVELEGNLSKCVEFKDMLPFISEFFAEMDCEGYSIILDKKLLKGDMNVKFAVTGYDREDLVVAHAEERGERLPLETVLELDEYLAKTGSGSSYMFTPIHFREQTVGYSIVKDGRFLYDNPFFYDIHSTVVRSVESLYKRKQLEWANRKLLDTYNRDPLTGVYNRMAYSNLIEPAYRKYREKGENCAMMFLDADRFKEVNDTMGHEYGDMVLKTIAKILRVRCPRGGYVFRFGGDEFIVFWPGATAESVAALKGLLEGDFAKAQIAVSMGFVLTDCTEDKGLNEYLSVADKKMYAEKSTHKSANI